jgi:hypothetical protein
MNTNNIPYENIKNFIENNNCILMTCKNEYWGTTQKLKIKCNCGKIFSTTFMNFKYKNVRMCRKCKTKIRNKKEYDNVKKYIEQDSNSHCILVTSRDEYENKREKLEIKCACGEIYNCSFNQFKCQNKTCCNKCTYKKLGEKFSEDFSEVINYINNEDTGNGCVFVSGEYINNESKLTIKCHCGNNFTTTYAQFKFANKKQCNDCGFKNKGQTRKLSYQYIKAFIEENDCVLLTKIEDYKNTSQTLDVKCKCGNIFNPNFILFKYGEVKRCNTCYRNSLSERSSLPYDEIKHFIEVDSGSSCKLITSAEEYINTRINVTKML